MNTIQLCVITDEGYTVPTTVMLSSVLLNKHTDTSYIVYCLCNNVSVFAKRKLQELNREDFIIKIIECDANKYASLKMPPNVTASTMIKCDLTELLPDVDKVLMLDGDILVTKDLADLWNTNLSDNLVAAVGDLVGQLDMHYCELLNVEFYFNAGVMLLNLAQMRKEHTGQKIIETKMKAPATWEWGEQDPFNKVCDGRLVKLPPRWNLTVLICYYRKHDVHDINKYYGTTYSNQLEMEDDAAIIHFNAWKPWKNRIMPFAAMWQKYHSLSPYRHTNTEHDGNYPRIAKPPTRITIKLLGCIPLLNIVESELRDEAKLFGLIKLYKIKKRKGIRKFLLFGFIPLYTSCDNKFVNV